MYTRKILHGKSVTIPAVMRKKNNFKPGTMVIFHEENDGIKIVRAATKKEVKENIGFLKTGGKLLKELMKEKRREKEL